MWTSTSRGQQSSSPKQWISLQRQLVPKVKERERKQQSGVGKGHLKSLNRDLILQSQDEGLNAPCDLQAVERIALRAQQIGTLDEEAILSCVRLRICDLSGCYVQDIRAFYGCVNLLKLDLSDNEISQLPRAEFWMSLVSLQVLYLDGNLINQREPLQRMNSCPRLHILTLYNTPFSLTRNYRHHVVNSVFSLKALDQHVVSDQEIIENFYVTETFRALSQHFKLPLRITIRPETSVKDEVRLVFSLLLSVDRVLAKHSPVLIIQRYTRSWLTRKTLKKTATHKIKNFLAKRDRLKSLPVLGNVDHSSYLVRRPTVIVTPPPAKGKVQHPQGEGAKEEGLPPPPPSSPHTPRALATHVLGVNSSNKVRYSMHINLGRLQHNIEETEKNAGTVEVLHGVLRKGKGGGRVCRANKKVQDSKTQDMHSRTSDRRTQDEQYVHVRTRDILHSRTLDNRTQDMHSRTDSRTQDMDSRTLDSRTDTRSPDKEKTGEEEVGKESTIEETSVTTGQDISVAGLTLAILPSEDLPDLATSKRDNVAMFRQAEKEIGKHLLRLKAPKQKKKQDGMSKSDFVFTRVYGTMSLSVMRKMDRVHQACKMREEHKERASKVAKVRREKVMQREQIEAYQNHLRERVRLWKCEEEGQLEQKRDELEKARQAKLQVQHDRKEADDLTAQKHHEDREFSSNFKQNSTLIANTISSEDRRASLSTSSATGREKVRQVRQESLEQQEEVRKYLEHRRNTVMWEGREDKKEVDTRTLERASQRMVEAKQRIAKEVARKAAARVAIAMAKEEMKACPHAPGEGIPATKGPVVLIDSDYPVSPQRVVGSEVKSHVTRNHYTWQRGADKVDQDQQFPVLLAYEDPAPLMYQRMLPSFPRKSAECTPFTELNSSTSSLTRPQLQVPQK